MAVVGREFPSDIIIHAPQISARHAEIRHLEEDRYVIRDLDSRNGTYVNGVRIQGEVTIRLSDEVKLGSYELDLGHYGHLIPVAG